MVVSCDIKFDQNALGTYYSGQIVTGTVTLRSDRPKDVKGVILKIAGYAKTGWSERNFKHRRQYTGREDYLSSLTYLLGSEQSDKYTIESGVHTYTFACQLPYNCPSSFEGTYGSIRYLAKVTLIRPWKFDQIYTQGFTVLKTVDLNYEAPQLKIPSNTEAYKIFCCGPCKTDPLKMELKLPQTGFVPGQIIPINVLVINNTNFPVAEVKFSLVMLVRYHSKHPQQKSRIERIAITKSKGDKVLRNCTRSLSTELQIPATCNTCTQFSNIIQIAYQVEVEAKVNGFHTNQVIAMPVIIGNIPLWNTVVQQEPKRSANVPGDLMLDLSANPANNIMAEEKQETEITIQTENTADQQNLTTVAIIPTAPVNTPTINYPNMPPPSYEKSAHTEHGNMNEDELHAFGPSEFTPLYPVYDISKFGKQNDLNTSRHTSGFVNQSFLN